MKAPMSVQHEPANHQDLFRHTRIAKKSMAKAADVLSRKAETNQTPAPVRAHHLLTCRRTPYQLCHSD